MSSYPKFLEENNIDPSSGCLVRLVRGGVDKFYPHSHSYYEIFIVVKGNIPHMVNGITQVLPEGSLVFIRPNDVHSHICTDPNTEFINLTFYKDTATKLLDYLFEDSQIINMLFCDMPPIVLLDKTNKKRLVSQINELNAENWKDKNFLRIRVKAILAGIFPYFINNTSDNLEESNAPLWLSQLINKMSNKENFVLGVPQMVKLSGKSREHLSRCFKKYYGTTLCEYINDLKVNYASNLLINTNLSVIDICFNCGFQSVSYFNKVFKNKNHLTPVEFRKKHDNQ